MKYFSFKTGKVVINDFLIQELLFKNKILKKFKYFSFFFKKKDYFVKLN